MSLDDDNFGQNTGEYFEKDSVLQEKIFKLVARANNEKKDKI